MEFFTKFYIEKWKATAKESAMHGFNPCASYFQGKGCQDCTITPVGGPQGARFKTKISIY